MLEEVKKDAAERMAKCVAAYRNELKRLRTGRASASLVDHIRVDYYGAESPLNQVANVAVEDARTLTIVPYDKQMVAVIEKAIMKSDLGIVMFIASANLVEYLPAPLLDRLEVIRFPGYTENEKKEIARRYLLPRQLRQHGLGNLAIDFTPGAVVKIIRDYTREAGLRNLDRELAAICRKLARLCLQDRAASSSLTVDEILVERFLGPRKFTHEIAEAGNQVGVTTGLVWTEFGGEIIFVEAMQMKGNKQLILTGSMGDVLQESAQTALSFVRSHAKDLGIDPDFFAASDIHIHIPSGAVPKEGPSAGVTLALALISLLTGRPARRAVG